MIHSVEKGSTWPDSRLIQNGDRWILIQKVIKKTVIWLNKAKPVNNQPLYITTIVNRNEFQPKYE